MAAASEEPIEHDQVMIAAEQQAQQELDAKHRPYHGSSSGRNAPNPILENLCPVTLAHKVQRMYRRMLGRGTCESFTCQSTASEA